MYHIIVFLPLLGAIIAGLIAIFGGAQRFPGGEPETGDGHGHGHAYAHRHGHAAHGEQGDHDREPAAAGSQAAEYITSGLLTVSAVLSWIAFFIVGYGGGAVERVPVLNWFTSGTLTVDWALRIDTLTAVMLVVVTTVSALVHIYSIGYMSHDSHRPRFFAYLSFFTFAMLALVTSDNLIQMFFGWEGVGVASYLLIGFWYKRPAANAAAIKAFIVNRIGDFGFALGIFGVFLLFNSVEFEAIFRNAPGLAGHTMHFLSWEFDALTVVCLLLFMGAMGKSAQFLLHTWLPDAMEGPTPVSALIHAATMVTAGVFMVARLSPLFELAPVALAFVAFIGATTAFFAASVGLVQNDIKRVVAYSTCSQLGYMFVALGMGFPGVAIFHLFTHAFFKALLFLGSGSVIHALSDEQDLRRMGGLKSVIPITYWAMVIGTLALTGFPFTAGFFSKDAIIESAFAGQGAVAGYAFLLTVVAALMTAFYSWRLIFLAFHGAPRAPADAMKHAHESPPVMTIPLGILAAGALFAGLIFSSSFIGGGAADFWRGSVIVPGAHAVEASAGHSAAPAAEHAEPAAPAVQAEEAAPAMAAEHVAEEHHAPLWVVLTPTVMMAIGFLIALWFYIYSPDTPRRLAEQQVILYRFLLNKWYFDEIYDFLFVRPIKWLGGFLWKKGDGWLIDGFGPDGISARVLDVTRNVVRLQTGYLYHYAFVMLIGLSLLITWAMFRG
jgi:NADH-quinone oxidoreductase subunit L